MNIQLVQITSTDDPSVNCEKISDYITQAKKDHNLDAVFLSEVFYSMSEGENRANFLVQKDNDHYKKIQSIAVTHKVALIGGSAATLVDNKVFNRIYNFDKEGNELGIYDKMNLFKADISKENEETKIVDEEKIYSKGNKQKVLEFGEWRIGMSLCFDLRFPEFFRNYIKKNVDIISIASAFTKTTGEAHWETLVRARAIENQCYVIAANQYGKNNRKMETFGHSLVVDPWGDILLNLKEGEGYGVCTLSKERIAKIRKRMKVPVLF